MKYLLMMQINKDVLDALSEQEQKAIGEGHQKFMDEIRASGEFIQTNALGDPSQGALVRREGGSTEVITDGPFVESKELLGGFYLVDVESKERAIELAKAIPDTQIEGLAVEVRPVIFSDGLPI